MNIFSKKKYYFFSVFLFLNINHFTLVASELQYLSADLKKFILKYIFENKQTEYRIAANNVVQFKNNLFTPYTNRSLVEHNNVIQIQNTIKGLNAATDKGPAQKKIENLHYVDMQAWSASDMWENGINYYVLLYIANKEITYRFGIGDLRDLIFECFDGMNSQNTALFAQSQEHTFNIYILHPYNIQTCDLFHHATYQGIGHLWSIMLHPEKNIIFYSSKHSNIDYKESPFTMGILDISSTDNSDIVTPTFEKYVDFLIQKTVYLGKETYLALTNTGKFIFLWEDINKGMEYAHQQHTSNIIDFAVDKTVITKNGFHPHIACLDNEGNFFVGNLLKFSQPTLFFVRKFIWDSQHKPVGLFYDKSHYGILYDENRNEKNIYCDGYAKLVLWPDNLDLLCMQKELLQKTKSRL